MSEGTLFKTEGDFVPSENHKRVSEIISRTVPQAPFKKVWVISAELRRKVRTFSTKDFRKRYRA